jgi:hypothetical protein
MSKSLKKQILFVTWKKVYDQVYYFKVRLRIWNQLCANVLDAVLNKVKDHE